MSLNKCFKKIPRDDDEPGKGAYWTVELDEMDDFEDGMFKRRRSCGTVNSTNNSTSIGNGINSNVTGPPKTVSNNAFLNGTGWSPSMNATPCKQQQHAHEFRTPQPAVKMSLTATSVPMTPLTMSMSSFKTPVKKSEREGEVHNSAVSAVLTPKIIANCSNRSPYTSLIRTSTNTNTSTNINTNTCINTTPKATEATFWSYPNLSLSQLGLDAEPPLPESENNFYNIFSNETTDTVKFPELFQGNITNIPSAPSAQVSSTEKDTIRMSPLSWLLSVSSQDSSLGLFDQSQQLLSEYLSLNNI